MVQLYHLQVIL